MEQKSFIIIAILSHNFPLIIYMLENWWKLPKIWQNKLSWTKWENWKMVQTTHMWVKPGWEKTTRVPAPTCCSTPANDSSSFCIFDYHSTYAIIPPWPSALLAPCVLHLPPSSRRFHRRWRLLPRMAHCQMLVVSWLGNV